jgi:hypothetical protein
MNRDTCDHCGISLPAPNKWEGIIWCDRCVHNEGKAILESLDLGSYTCRDKACSSIGYFPSGDADKVRSVPTIYRCPQCGEIHP